MPTAPISNHSRTGIGKNPEPVASDRQNAILELLPAEILKNIAGRLSRDDLRCFHLGGPILRNGSRDEFRDSFREISVYLHQAISLKRLNEVANDSIFGPRVRTLRLVIAHFLSKEEEKRMKVPWIDNIRSGRFKNPEVYNVEDQYRWNNARDRGYLTMQPTSTRESNHQQLTNAISKLPGLIEVWICNIDDKTTAEDYTRGLGINTLSKTCSTKPLTDFPEVATRQYDYDWNSTNRASITSLFCLLPKTSVKIQTLNIGPGTFSNWNFTDDIEGTDFKEALSDLRLLVFRDLHHESFRFTSTLHRPGPTSLLHEILNASCKSLETLTVEENVLHRSAQSVHFNSEVEECFASLQLPELKRLSILDYECLCVGNIFHFLKTPHDQPESAGIRGILTERKRI